jgi:hypothetical protein
MEHLVATILPVVDPAAKAANVQAWTPGGQDAA